MLDFLWPARDERPRGLPLIGKSLIQENLLIACAVGKEEVEDDGFLAQRPRVLPVAGIHDQHGKLGESRINLSKEEHREIRVSIQMRDAERDEAALSARRDHIRGLRNPNRLDRKSVV